MRQTIHFEQIGPRYFSDPYKIVVENKEEFYAELKREIDNILQILGRPDIGVEEIDILLMKGERRLRRNAENINSILQEPWVGDEGKILSAIGLWLARELGKWNAVSSTARPLRGGEYDLRRMLQKEGEPNCIDVAVMKRETAALFGIKGSVRSIRNQSRHHHYFQTDSGMILDILCGRDDIGLFKDEEDLYRRITVIGPEFEQWVSGILGVKMTKQLTPEVIRSARLRINQALKWLVGIRSNA